MREENCNRIYASASTILISLLDALVSLLSGIVFKTGAHVTMPQTTTTVVKEVRNTKRKPLEFPAAPIERRTMIGAETVHKEQALPKCLEPLPSESLASPRIAKKKYEDAVQKKLLPPEHTAQRSYEKLTPLVTRPLPCRHERRIDLPEATQANLPRLEPLSPSDPIRRRSPNN